MTAQAGSGCRAGDACPYLHDESALQVDDSGNRSADERNDKTLQTAEPSAVENRKYQAPPVSQSKVVTKPVSRSQAQNPRKFQLDQLKRRYNTVPSEDSHETILTFKLNPSDPDFPFELDGGLHCRLHVPLQYPGERPHLDVTNEEMGRGFQVNVEKGFDELARSLPGSTLLGLVNNLDRRLEDLLSGEKADTIKIVRNAAPKDDHSVPELEPPPPSPPLPPVESVHQGPRFTHQQLAEAESKRKADIRQLEARLGRMQLFEKSTNGLSYMVPVQLRKRDELPVPLQNVKSVELTVPQLYPLEPSTIRIFGVPREAAEATEEGFVQHVIKMRKGNLLGFLNYLSSSMHILAKTSVEKYVDRSAEAPNPEILEISEDPLPVEQGKPYTGGNAHFDNTDEDDRSHIHYIPRPLEWSMPQNEGSESDSDEEDGSDENYADLEEERRSDTEDLNDGPERGISMSLPHLELYGIELLELLSLALTVRCLRCKDSLDIQRIHHETPKLDSCKKCAQAFSIAYRRELMHAGNVKAGYLDLDGCTVADLLPSQFTPTCSNCSTPHPPPGMVSVRGESSMSICRECHSKMTFKIPEVRFLQVTANEPKNRPPPRKKVRENLGIAAGTELPNRGRCEHYRKSYRWFRFSCCNKVFACDRCHDAAADHPNEHANRMLCGWCSREQLFRPETCAFCRQPVIGRRAGGFWEGGKGTRDKTLMSRKDPRKWKRRPAGMPPGQGSIKK